MKDDQCFWLEQLDGCKCHSLKQGEIDKMKFNTKLDEISSSIQEILFELPCDFKVEVLLGKFNM